MELCGDSGGRCLEGLPLALVQAGSYMARFDCSFVEYRDMLEKANGIDDMHDILKNAEVVKSIRKSHRSIWTTWKISVRQLSREAYAVLRAMAILGPSRVGEAIIKGMVREVAAKERGAVDQMFR